MSYEREAAHCPKFVDKYHRWSEPGTCAEAKDAQPPICMQNYLEKERFLNMFVPVI